MNMKLLFAGNEREFEAYIRLLKTECLKAGVDLPDYRIEFPVDLYFTKDALPVILKNTVQYDYIDTCAQGRLGKWKTHLIVFLRNVFASTILALFGYKKPFHYDIPRSTNRTKTWHIIILGIKKDKTFQAPVVLQNPDGSERIEYRERERR